MAAERFQRRLAAILAADVVGFSRLMEADESGTLTALKSRRKNVLDPLVARHQGRIFKVAGDGVLVEFGSAVNALQCAVDLQQAMAAANGDQPNDCHIVLRIGVNLGDVMVEGSDLYGDGVNIAVRLQAIAEPGGILVSGTAFEHTKSKVKVGFDDLGTQALKNIVEPIRAYRVSGAPRVTIAVPKAQSEKPSIAVLPFVNMSGDPEQDYFSDGITEDLITQLSRFRDLFVISRNSSFVFKGRAVNIAEIAGKLGVHFVAEGSIRKAGDRIRVTVQLIDAMHDVHVWSERYDRKLEDIFDVQDEVVRAIAATLVGRLEQAALERAKNRPSGDLRAYEHYLRALKHFVAWTPQDNRKARELLEAAIKADPNYAAAYAALAETVFRDWYNGWSSDPQRDFTASHEAAARSVQLDDEDSRTHAVFGIASLYHGQRDRARLHLDRAIQLNPSNAFALVLWSSFELFAGNHQASADRVREALRLNPFGKYGWYLAKAHYAARRYDEATANLKSLSDPTFVVKTLLAASQAMSGEVREAIANRDAVVEAAKTVPGLGERAGPPQWRRFVTDRWPFRNQSDLEHLFDGLRRAGLPL
jgi:TolB-like protein/Tfp pilus assembly protein PilF